MMYTGDYPYVAKETGWICPKCGRVFAPWVTMCPFCYNYELAYKIDYYKQQPSTTGSVGVSGTTEMSESVYCQSKGNTFR